MNQDRVDETERCLTGLAAMSARLDPVPPEIFASAVAFFAWRTIDAELAELVSDSASGHDEAVAMPSSGRSRQLSFVAPQLAIELEVDSGAEYSLVGQLVPAIPVEIEIRGPHRSMTVQPDDQGRFSTRRCPGRTISLRITRPSNDRDSVTTPWVSFFSPGSPMG